MKLTRRKAEKGLEKNPQENGLLESGNHLM